MDSLSTEFPLFFDGLSKGRKVEPTVITDLLEEPKVPLDLYHLAQAGDYACFTQDRKSIGVERKSVSDLFHSMGQRRRDAPTDAWQSRLSRQLNKLRTAFDLPVLLIEGLVECTTDGKVLIGGRRTRWPYHLWVSWQLSVPARIIHVDGIANSVWFLNHLRWVASRRPLMDFALLWGWPTGQGLKTEALNATPC